MSNQMNKCWRCRKPKDFPFLDDNCKCTIEQLEEHYKKMDEYFKRQFNREPAEFKSI